MQMEIETPEAYARQTITHAIRTHRHEIWTPQSLASRYGISAALAGRVLSELARAGVAERLEGPDDEYAAAGMDY